MSKVVFTGCSFTAGDGWAEMADPDEGHNLECKDHSDLWVNLCATQIDQLKDLEVVNLGKGGASNAEIFANTVGAIGNFGAEIDTLICQWTSMPSIILMLVLNYGRPAKDCGVLKNPKMVLI